MKYHSIKKDNLKDYTKPAFLIENSKLLQKYNMTSLKDYVAKSLMKYIITDIRYIHMYNDIKIFKNISKRYFCLRIFQICCDKKYEKLCVKIDDCCENHRIYLIGEINVKLGCEDIVSFDSDFK